MSLVSAILTVFQWAAVGLAVVLMIVNLFLARRRSLIMAFVRVGITVGSIVLAVLLAKPISTLLTDIAYDFLLPVLRAELGDTIDLNGIIAATPAGEEGLKVLVSLLIAPLVFLLLFLLFRGLLSIPGAILAALVPGLKKKEKALQAATMPIGALNGLLIAMTVLVPICGFLTIGGHMMNTVADTARACDSHQVTDILNDMETTPDQLEELGVTLQENPVVLVVHSTLGRPVFGSLTTGNTRASATHNKTLKLNLETEIGGLLETGIYLLDAMGSFEKEDYTEADKNKLYRFEESMLDSEWRTMLVTDVLTDAATHWRRGEAFAGLERPVIDANVDPLINRVLDVMTHESDRTLEEDLHDILDVVGDFLMCDLLASEIEPQEMLLALAEKNILTTTMEKLHANPRLAPIADELKATSMRLLTHTLGLDELKNGEHADLMANVASELNNVLDLSEEERHEVVADALGNAFAEYGVEVPADAANQLADQAIADLGADGEITPDELTEYLVTHTEDVTDLLPDEGLDTLPDDIPEIPID